MPVQNATVVLGTDPGKYKKNPHMLSQFIQEIYDVKAGNLKEPHHCMLIDDVHLQIRAGHKFFHEAAHHAWENHELTQIVCLLRILIDYCDCCDFPCSTSRCSSSYTVHNLLSSIYEACTNIQSMRIEVSLHQRGGVGGSYSSSTAHI